jgi:hypothetical protein
MSIFQNLPVNYKYNEIYCENEIEWNNLFAINWEDCKKKRQYKKNMDLYNLKYLSKEIDHIVELYMQDFSYLVRLSL